MDEQRLMPFLTEGCRFVFGNQDPVVGRAHIGEYSSQFMTQIARIDHHLFDVWGFDDVIVSKIEVTYTRNDRSTVIVPTATIWRVHDRQIYDYRIYVDVTSPFVH